MKTLKRIFLCICWIMTVGIDFLIYILSILGIWGSSFLFKYEFTIWHVLIITIIFPFYLQMYVHKKLNTKEQRDKDLQTIKDEWNSLK